MCEPSLGRTPTGPGVVEFILSTVSTHAFHVQFQHTHFMYSFNTHISGTISTKRFDFVVLKKTFFQKKFKSLSS